MKKRISNYLLLTTYYLLGLIPLARAGPVEGLEQLTGGARDMVGIILRFINDLIFDLNTFDEFLFAKILLALIIFFVVYSVLRKNDIFGSSKGIARIIAAAITILSVRYLPVGFVETILIQYGSFAVAVTTFLPLLIFFFFLYQSDFGSFGRRFGWILYGTSMIFLTAFRSTEMGGSEYIYYAGIIGVAIAFIFDGTINAQFNKRDLNEIRKSRDMQSLIDIRSGINERRKYLDDNKPSPKLKRKIEKEIEKLEEREEKIMKRIS